MRVRGEMILHDSLFQAPLPSFHDLMRGVFSSPPDEKMLAQPWVRDGDSSFWFSRSAWSLYAVAEWRKRITKASHLTIWIPDFFCNESLALLRESGASLYFYSVGGDGYPQIEQFENLISKGKPDLVLLVHYFGVPIVCSELVLLCKQQGAWLVEDAAHVLQPVAGVGEHGDCILYSPHKHLAIPDGALLVVREEGPTSIVMKEERTRKLLHKVLIESGVDGKRSTSSSYLWLFKRLLQMMGVRGRSSPPPFREERKQEKRE